MKYNSIANTLRVKITVYLVACLALLLYSAGAMSQEYSVKAKAIPIDEYSYRGEPVNLYIESKPAVIFVVPKSTPMENLALLAKEVDAIQAFFPENRPPDFIVGKAEHGVIEINDLMNRYIFEINENTEPGIIMTEGYYDTTPMFAPLRGDVSLLQEFISFFEVKSKKQLKRYIDKRVREVNSKRVTERNAKLGRIMRAITTKHMPALTEAQIKQINKGLFSRLYKIVGISNDKNHFFDKPFKKLEIDNKAHWDYVIYRNSQQQRIFSHAQISSDNNIYATHYYHPNGLLSNSYEKEVEVGSSKHVNHRTGYFFWQSDYEVLSYSIDQRASAHELSYTRVTRLTFDKQYRVVKEEILKFDSDTFAVSKGTYSVETRYLDNGDYEHEVWYHGATHSLERNFFENGKISKVESTVKDQFFAQEYRGNEIVWVAKDGSDIRREMSYFDKDGYLIKKETKGGPYGDTAINYTYTK